LRNFYLPEERYGKIEIKVVNLIRRKSIGGKIQIMLENIGNL
jgi:hypothetical protein